MGPRAETSNGTVEGAHENDVDVFRGIPYARPLIGELRFAPPQPAVAWTGVRPATAFGPAAPQPATDIGALIGFGADETSEDCLTLNVWTPAAGDGRRPVMVWIHGGAFVYGSGSQPIYDGGPLARRGDVVVVTINYRLGALGFLHLDDVAGDEMDQIANRGLLDQVAALEWVRDNIDAFGGDPSNVTIFGESAGSISVAALLGMPAAQGLFHRAVLQSGAASVHSSADATEVTRTLLKHLDLEPGDVRKLLEVPVDALLDAQQQCWLVTMTKRRALPFLPVVDGAVFPRAPLEAVADGLSADVPVLVGTNADEWRFFGFIDPESFGLDEASLLARLEHLTGSRGRALVEAYAAARPGALPPDLWFALETDGVFRVPATRLAEAQGRRQPTTFAYLFTWCSPVGGLGACHALDIPFVFGTLDKPGMALFAGETPEAHALSETMMDAWLAFARGGDPGHGGLPAWPAYDPEQRATMLLGETCQIEHAPFDAERRAWEGLLEGV